MRACQKYLVASDDDGTKYPVIKRPEPMFWYKIQQPNAIPSNDEWDQSSSHIGAARSFFERKTQSALDDIQDPEDQLEHLKTLRNNILKARIIQVELSSEEDGFLIFETLNTRGKDLLVADLIKNILVRGISTDPMDRAAVADRWGKITASVAGESGEAEIPDRFIWQSWNSRREAVKEPELYKAAKRLLQDDPSNLEKYLIELEEDARTYRYLEGASLLYPVKSKRERSALAFAEVQRSIKALSIFNVSVANSAILALVRKFNKTRLLSESQLIKSMKYIENFHFQFTQLAKGGSTGGTRSRYNRFAVDLEKAQTKTQVNSAIEHLREKLEASLPEKARVQERFESLFYAPNESLTVAQRQFGRSDLIRYVLLSMAEYSGKIPAHFRSDGWTIEHIKPQSHRRERSVHDPVFSIGNLVPLTGKINQKLDDATFDKKRDEIEMKTGLADETLMKWIRNDQLVDISESDIRDRARTLSRTAIEEVWAL